MNQDDFGFNENVPEALREIFMWLCQDVASLFQMWSFYLGLFGNEENYALISQSTPIAFIVIEEALRISMTMAICRLNDPSTQFAYVNVSMHKLVEFLPDHAELNKLDCDFFNACKPFEIYRNKRFAHRDLLTTLDHEGAFLPGICKGDVENVLDLSAKIINVFTKEFSDSEYYFHTKSAGGSEQLLYWINEGLKSRNPLSG